jgi:hypothetical protein
MWLEPDSIPLKAGWLTALTEEYEKAGKPYMLSSDSNPPHDPVGGIGIYGPDTHWMIPDFFPRNGWDLWMLKHLSYAIHRTPLIQHTYGSYDAAGIATAPRPRNGKIVIREDAVIFHRDPYQDLMSPVKRPVTFLHTGDLGDIIAAMPLMRQVGGCHVILTDSPLYKLRPMLPRVHLIRDLLISQHYIHGVHAVEKIDRAAMDYDVCDFREVYQRNRTLTESQGDWIKITAIDMNPWLHVTPSPRTAGRIVVSRSERYNNPMFPWRRIVNHYGDACVFVGLPHEHKIFQRFVAKPIEFLPTANLLEVAEAIAGSELFIGNQSSPCWCAMGLGHPLIQETHMTQMDSIVRRPNAQFVQNGKVVLP